MIDHTSPMKPTILYTRLIWLKFVKIWKILDFWGQFRHFQSFWDDFWFKTDLQENANTIPMIDHECPWQPTILYTRFIWFKFVKIWIFDGNVVILSHFETIFDWKQIFKRMQTRSQWLITNARGNPPSSILDSFDSNLSKFEFLTEM